MRNQIIAGMVVMGLLAALWWGWQRGAISSSNSEAAHAHADGHAEPAGDEQSPVKISPQAKKNLGLVSLPLKLTTYWRTIELPGEVVDKPGMSDRGVVAPIAGTVIRIHTSPGSTVVPDAPLFTIRLVSESLHSSQLELFKATREIEIAWRQRQRLADLTQSGALAQTRLIEIENQLDRTQATVDAYRQDLAAHGLSNDRIEAVARGEFVTEMLVRAPGEQPVPTPSIALTAGGNEEPQRLPFSFEVQSLGVELGQQVEAGHVLCKLADHRSLLIEGHAFKDEIPLLQDAARNDWEVEVDPETPASDRWPPMPAKLKIDHLSNSVDPETRTFSFYLALENQWQSYNRNDAVKLIWRFRPGSRVRLRVAVEKMDNVLVVPQAAVVREGPEAYVFRQNGDLFDRRTVHVLYEDRLHAVLASDGSIRPGFYVAQNSAASLNRVLKAQLASGVPAGMHVHADGSVHGAH